MLYTGVYFYIYVYLYSLHYTKHTILNGFSFFSFSFLFPPFPLPLALFYPCLCALSVNCWLWPNCVACFEVCPDSKQQGSTKTHTVGDSGCGHHKNTYLQIGTNIDKKHHKQQKRTCFKKACYAVPQVGTVPDTLDIFENNERLLNML